MDETLSYEIEKAIADEMARIRRLFELDEGQDKEDLISYAKDVARMRWMNENRR